MKIAQVISMCEMPCKKSVVMSYSRLKTSHLLSWGMSKRSGDEETSIQTELLMSWAASAKPNSESVQAVSGSLMC